MLLNTEMIYVCVSYPGDNMLVSNSLDRINEKININSGGINETVHS